MAEYIKREDVLAEQFETDEYNAETDRFDMRVVDVADIKFIPAEDVAPVIHGHIVWKKRHRGGFTKKKCIKNGGYDCDHNAVIDDRSAGEEPYCSECGKILGDYMNFCGNCGARMDGDKR